MEVEPGIESKSKNSFHLHLFVTSEMVLFYSMALMMSLI